jgi:ParB family chromosome partitioning protein
VKHRELPIGEISAPRGRRLRGDVQHLAASIATVGLLHPLTVTPDGRLVAGLHRLAAVKALGWTRVPVIVIDADAMSREIATLDENLVRHELSVLDRAEALRRRKLLYEALHPETRRGVAGGHAKARAHRGGPYRKRIGADRSKPSAAIAVRRLHRRPRDTRGLVPG